MVLYGGFSFRCGFGKGLPFWTLGMDMVVSVFHICMFGVITNALKSLIALKASEPLQAAGEIER